MMYLQYYYIKTKVAVAKMTFTKLHFSLVLAQKGHSFITRVISKRRKKYIYIFYILF